jgi:Glycosyltransferase Family 4
MQVCADAPCARTSDSLLQPRANSRPRSSREISGGHSGRWPAPASQRCPTWRPRLFLARERARPHSARREPPRTVALVADLVDGVDGVTRLLDELRARGVADWEVDVIGTDAAVGRRLPTAVEVELPYYAGRRVGVPSLVGLAEALTSRRYALVHMCSPGPAGVGAVLVAELAGLPLIMSHHTELTRYARLRSGRVDIERLARAGIAALYSCCRVILSPSSASDSSLLALGVDSARIARWTRGVDTTLFRPRASRAGDGSLRVLYSGRLSTEKGMALADALVELAAAPERRAALGVAAAAAAQRRTWDAAFAELASGYQRAVTRPERQERTRAA